MTRNYQTNQRRVIYNFFLANSKEHMTAGQVLRALRGNGHRIGRATVYRYLEKLSEEGILRKHTSERGRATLYEYCVGDGGFYHLKCDICGDLRHLTPGSVPVLFSHIKADYGFIIDPLRTVFHGTCGGCRSRGDRNR